jgi:hypothetical protein
VDKIQARYAFLDFEFRGVSEPTLDLVCASLEYNGHTEEFWLFRNTNNLRRLQDSLTFLQKEGVILVAYSAEAEASSLISAGIDPLMFKWIDLFLEYRMLQNHDHKLMFGKQLIDGKIKVLPPFGEKGKQNLAAACYKLLGEVIDTEEKNAVREIIIYGTDEEVLQAQNRIQKYCTSDIKYLSRMLQAIKKLYSQKIPRKDGYGWFQGDMLGLVKQEAHWRAEAAVRTAIMVRHGYPINVEWAQNLTDNIPMIIREMQEDINSQFPDVKPFKWNKAERRYSMDQKAVKGWIAKHHRSDNWESTATGDFSLKEEAWSAFYSFRHDFPRHNFGAQMVRWLKTSSSLKGFKERGGSQKTTFWDHVGKDGFVRSYINPYGAQSSRYQPGSVGFLFLKSAWQRSLCQAPDGYAVGTWDYSSQEVLLAAILSGDKKLYEAYCSGDVYLAYGKEIGAIPADGTKKTHEKERDEQKPVILGWQYWITEYGLARQLTQQRGRYVDPEDALPLLQQLDETYCVFADQRQRFIDQYQAYKYLKLPDGWYMWGDNPSERSVANCHVQGMGGVIARKFVQLAQDRGLHVLFPLHDAGYIMFKVGSEGDMESLRECMYEAFIHYFSGWQREWAMKIRLDGKAWSNQYQDGEFVTKSNFVVKTSPMHIDKRAQAEYNQFSKYFLNKLDSDLL